MKKVWQLFVGDLKRLTSNVITGIIALGLIVLPSIFSWYNMIAAWDVFGNTGNLSIAVASVDEGYKSDLIPVEINVGEKVVSALRANSQIKWVFTDEDDAIDGARSGKYYAAVVIPESFSRDMLTFYSDDVDHAKIVYYSNEKKNAISPKVTDQGADAISVQVNQVFAETLSDTALSLAQSVLTYTEQTDADGQIGQLADHITTLAERMSKSSQVLRTYSSVLTTSQNLVNSSANMLSSAQAAANEISGQVESMESSGEGVADAMQTSANSLTQALQASADSFGAVTEAIDYAFDSADTTADASSAMLRQQASGLDTQVENYRNLAQQIEDMKSSVSEDYQQYLQTLADQLNSSADLMENLSESLTTAADNIDTGTANIAEQRAAIKQQAEDARQEMANTKAYYDENFKPQFESLMSSVSDLSDSISAVGGQLNSAADSLTGAAGSVSDNIGQAKTKLESSADALDASSAKLGELSTSLKEALSSGNVELVKEVLGGDMSSLSTALSTPVQLERHALFESGNFGSSMAPLYTTLALWIGSLLIMVTLSPKPSRRIEDSLGGISLPQQFLGRFGVVSLLTFIQDTVLAVGNMCFLGVHVDNPLLYLLCFWICGQVFSLIIYTFVVSFANLGKAFAVILLILQVAGANGAYPITILPQFFQDLCAWLPATHVIDAMRAAMFGVYNNDFWIQIGIVLLYILPCALLGLVLRNPTMKLIEWYVEQVEKSHIA